MTTVHHRRLTPFTTLFLLLLLLPLGRSILPTTVHNRRPPQHPHPSLAFHSSRRTTITTTTTTAAAPTSPASSPRQRLNIQMTRPESQDKHVDTILFVECGTCFAFTVQLLSYALPSRLNLTNLPCFRFWIGCAWSERNQSRRYVHWSSKRTFYTVPW
jgi:hypothetical protein